VEHEPLDFFASGHPLVEAVLGEYVEGTRGQTALVEVPESRGFTGCGVLVVAKEGPEVRWTFVDLEGRERPELAGEVLGARDAREVPAGRWPVPDWSERVRSLLAEVDLGGRFAAVCGVLFRGEPQS
jgi:hypothetical protein